ncbi:MAG: cache domain-containing protein [Arcobacteraceae bacterium]|nr:cache domain-containing protein [Arcobacteraceae bacterium]
MILSEKSIFKLTIFIPIISLLLLSIILTYSIINYQHDFLEKEYISEKESYIKSQKELIENEVNKVFELIEFKKQTIHLRLKKQIKNNLNSYYSIIDAVYTQNKDTKTKEQIFSIIRKTLQNVRLKNSDGYLNIISTKGVAIMLPIQDHYEDLSILNFRDKDNTLYIKTALDIAQNDGKGYHKYYEVKPYVEQSKEFLKINYIKIFKPLGIILSVGDYVVNIDKEIKSEIIDRVNTIRFGKKGYLYIVNNDGKLLAHKNKQLIGTNSFNIKDINGKYYFKEGFKLAKKNGNVYLEYISTTNMGSKDMRNARKLTFVKYSEEYDFVISAGVYIDDIDKVLLMKKNINKEKFEHFTTYIVLLAILLSILVIVISYFLATNIKKAFKNYQYIVKKNEKKLHKINLSLEDNVKVEVNRSREKDAQLLSQARFASLGEMIGNIAHQWRQPLSAISTISSGNIIQSQIGILTNNENEKSYNQIIGHVRFLSQTIDDFRNYMKDSGDSNEEFNIANTINSILSIVEIAYKDNDIILFKDFTQSELLSFGSTSQLSQVILNILNNAKDILVEKKIIKKVVKITTERKNNKNNIKIYDNGGGIPSDIIEKIFDPYFTTKHQSQGTGIGLYMSKDIIKNKFSGTLEVTNVNWKYEEEMYFGACFTIVI